MSVPHRPSTTLQPATVFSGALPVGAYVGRYEIRGYLGQGSFGITYRAFDRQLNRDVAIKEYLPSSLAMRKAASFTVQPRSTGHVADYIRGRDGFLAEGRTLARLQNVPAIVHVFDFLKSNGTAYIVMLYIEGTTLESRLEHGRLPSATIDGLLWPLLDGLEHVHAAGFLHRDIKPANILLEPSGKATLVDFGAARAAMLGTGASMTAMLTPAYAAPEQFGGARQGPWTDIYGLAATLYRAIDGCTPPSAPLRSSGERYQPLAQRDLPGLSRALLLGIDAGLALQARDRPQSIAGWRALLRDASIGARTTVVLPRRQTARDAATRRSAEETTATMPSIAPWKQEWRWWRIPLAGTAAVLGLAVLAGSAQRIFLTSPIAPAAMPERAAPERSSPGALPEKTGSPQAPRPTSTAGPFDGRFRGTFAVTLRGRAIVTLNATLRIQRDRISGEVTHPTCGTFNISLAAARSGDVIGNTAFRDPVSCEVTMATGVGLVSDTGLLLELRSDSYSIKGLLPRLPE